MPQLGETVAEGTVTRWYKNVGDRVAADEILFDVETDKVSTEIPAPVGGVVAEILVDAGATAKVGARLAVIREAGSAESHPAPTAAKAPDAVALSAARSTASAAAAPPAAEPAQRLSPVVRKLIAEHALDPSSIRGTGRDGRITREDVLEVLGRTTVPASAPQPGRARAGERVPLNSVRRRTAERVAQAWATAPHVLQVAEADFQRVEQAQKALGAKWQARHGFPLTYLPFVVHAVAGALASYPHLNATYDDGALIVHARINIGIAVDLGDGGLVAPVLQDVPEKSLTEIARAIRDLAQRARSGQLRPDELAGGTYTVSNNGAFGTVITAPIINLPQVAILSTDRVRKKPVVIEGPDGDMIAIRPIGVLAQSFDHRAVDGAYAAAFLREAKAILESRDWIAAMSN